jgi:serine/threonine protein kinase
VGASILQPAGSASVPSSRAPALCCARLQEVLALPYVSPAYDVWSLGCLAYALATGQDLFAPQVALLEEPQQQPQPKQQPQQQQQGEEGERAPLMTLEERHLVDMLALLGRPPLDMVAASPLRQALFRPSGRLRAEGRFRVVRESLERVLAGEHGLREEEVGGGRWGGGG